MCKKNKNGIFIELTPNLVGMAEYTNELKYGETAIVQYKLKLNEKFDETIVVTKAPFSGISPLSFF